MSAVSIGIRQLAFRIWEGCRTAKANSPRNNSGHVQKHERLMNDPEKHSLLSGNLATTADISELETGFRGTGKAWITGCRDELRSRNASKLSQQTENDACRCSRIGATYNPAGAILDRC